MAQLSSELENARQHSTVPISIPLTLIIILGCLFRLYQVALPKPIPGIPYNKDSARKLFGDGQAYLEHVKQNGGTFATYCRSTVKSLDAPLVQIFIQPFKQPLLILADFRESQGVMRRPDFDRSDDMGDMLRGLFPKHHILMKTNAAWKAQRVLIKDLMNPSWLHRFAAPATYQHAVSLVELWSRKAVLADGRAFEASQDLRRLAMDAVMSFSFGERFRDSATDIAVETLRAKNPEFARPDGPDLPAEFPVKPLRPILEALDSLFALIAEIRGSPKPTWTWAFILSKPWNARALRLRDTYITNELKYAAQQLQGGGGDDQGKSAVHHMVLREKSIAEKQGRKPDYLSKIMIDEVTGFAFAGMDSTGTTMSWAVKLLTDHPQVTRNLRAALRASFTAAHAEGRNPTVEELVGTHVPYLEATLAEIARRSGTTPIVDRQANVDTELLGYHIPKNTTVACLVIGPSMTEPSFDIDESRRHETVRGAQVDKVKAWDEDDIALFKPERWIQDGKFDAAAGPQLIFGLGPRACYGKRLGFLNLRIVFALLVWNFDLLPCPESLSGYSHTLLATERPDACYVRLHKIGPSA